MICSTQHVSWLMLKREPIIFFSRMERLRREEELKGRTAKKAQEMEQSLLNKVGAFQCCMVLLPLFTDSGHWCCLFIYLDLQYLCW
jgi:hypothetical protein